MSRAEEIAANLARVEERIRAACQRAKRSREEVTLVAVTKTFPSSDVDHAIAAGVTHVGENKVQEARDKKPLVRSAAKWHLIGHLQSNKAKDAVRVFDVIQTIDSFELAERVARLSDTRRDVMLQVNIGREAQKSGVEVEEVDDLAKRISGLPQLRLAGLMAIPPVEGEVRPYFRELRSLRDHLGLPELSMGMTDDFEAAIEEGATIIRVGRAIFGARG